MTTKNIKDVVAEKTEKLHYELVALMEQPEAFQQAIRTTLTQLVKDVEAGERERLNEAKNIVNETLHELRDYCENNQQGYWYAFTNAENKLNQALTPPYQ